MLWVAIEKIVNTKLEVLAYNLFWLGNLTNTT